MPKKESTQKSEIISKLEEARLLVFEYMSRPVGLGSQATYTNTWTIIDAIDEAIRGVKVGSYGDSWMRLETYNKLGEPLNCEKAEP
jgi:hypothetical protein